MIIVQHQLGYLEFHNQTHHQWVQWIYAFILASGETSNFEKY